MGKRKKKKIVDNIKEYFEKLKPTFEMQGVDPARYASYIGVTIIIKAGIEWGETLITNLPKLMAIFAFFPQEFEQIGKELDTPKAEMFQWIISFALAYMIVENFGEIVKSGTSIIDLAKQLIGSGAPSM